MWSKVARQLNLDFHKKEVRTGRQCKKRWFQVLLPLQKFEWTEEKEALLQETFQEHGQNYKGFLEECRKKIRGLNKHQIKIKLDFLLEKINLENQSAKELSLGKVKQKNENKVEPKVSKKIKINESSIEILCNSLMESL